MKTHTPRLLNQIKRVRSHQWGTTLLGVYSGSAGASQTRAWKRPSTLGLLLYQRVFQPLLQQFHHSLLMAAHAICLRHQLSKIVSYKDPKSACVWFPGSVSQFCSLKAQKIGLILYNLDLHFLPLSVFLFQVFTLWIIPLGSCFLLPSLSWVH